MDSSRKTSLINTRAIATQFANVIGGWKKIIKECCGEKGVVGIKFGS